LKNPNKLTVTLETGATTALVYRANSDRGRTLILGHGAGAGQQSAFIVAFARALSALDVTVVTFNFPYIEQGRRIPDRAPVLESCFHAVVDAARADVAPAPGALFIGGKSMGARIATQVAAADSGLEIDGLVLLGYPLHPPGRPTERRDKHLPSVGRPMLFIQGTRDTFGTPGELEPVLLNISPTPVVHIVNGGDHSFKVTKRDADAQLAVYADVQRIIVSWMEALERARSEIWRRRG
jgi:predicted alpha/beta-hydrolase family hydrolase